MGDAAAPAAAGPSADATQAGAGPSPAAAEAPAPAAGQPNRPQPAAGTIGSFLNALGIKSGKEAGVKPTGSPLTKDQERTLIQRRWRQPD